ncbi:DUF4383 domain-containing protein [Methylorubrum extorquens]
MSIRTFALIYGIVFVLAGAGGFIPGLNAPPHEHPDMTLNTSFGYLMGLFPVNILHNLVHLAFGVWGLSAYRSAHGARAYARGVAVIYAVLAIGGLIPGLQTTFGLIPLFSHDVWLHIVLAAGAAYFGFVHRNNGMRTTGAHV